MAKELAAGAMMPSGATMAVVTIRAVERMVRSPMTGAEIDRQRFSCAAVNRAFSPRRRCSSGDRTSRI